MTFNPEADATGEKGRGLMIPLTVEEFGGSTVGREGEKRPSRELDLIPLQKKAFEMLSSRNSLVPNGERGWKQEKDVMDLPIKKRSHS